MQVGHLSLIPRAEFASVSILSSGERSSGVAEGDQSLSIVSPTGTTSLSHVTAAVTELASYVKSLREDQSSNKEMGQSTTENGDNSKPSMPLHSAAQTQILLGDSNQINDNTVQVYRPSSGNGIALHFLVVREASIVEKCSSAILVPGSNKSAARPNKGEAVALSASGILVCVGVSGLSYAQSSSSLVNTLGRRMVDFVGVLRSLRSFTDLVACKNSVKAVLSTMVLTDDEERKTNAMVEEEVVSLSSGGSALESPSDKLKSTISALKNKRGPSRRSQLKRGASGGYDLRLAVDVDSNADLARISTERLVVLSLSENDAKLTRYDSTGQQRRSAFELGLGKSRVRSRRRKAGEEVDLIDFECPGSAPASSPKTAAPTRLVRPGPRQLDAIPSDDRTSSRSLKKSAVPMLTAPRNDVSRIAAGRKAAQSSARRGVGAAGASRSERFGSPVAGNSFRHSTVNGTQNSGDALNLFDTNPSGIDQDLNLNESFSSLSFKPGLSDSEAKRGATDSFGFGVDTSKSPSRRGFDPFSSDIMADWSSGAMSNGSPGGSFQQTRPGGFEDMQTQQSGSVQQLSSSRAAAANSRGANGEGERDDFGFSASLDRTSPNVELAQPSPSDESNDFGGNEDTPRLTVNIALNEDLTCSYKQSKISSCSVEGVVQVQVSSDARNGVPFFLFVRDPSQHIKVIQENRRFADDITQAVVDQDEIERGADYKFTVSVPKAENYFPIMRYKCSSDLRPVPIRVQTRVRLNGAHCRVALQISSNPANEDDLTDLTIVMGVPSEVKGETLITSPAGGVWNAAKRSVVWCVAELGDGEKFQLIAQFDVDADKLAASETDKPRFPVLVRCQCMYSQLSDVELEVSDIPEIFPADVSMKLARRFRLSHRERS